MKAIFRNILALIVGVVVGIVFAAIAQNINLQVHPYPAGVDPRDAETLRAHMASQPASALLVLLGGYLVGFTAAVFVATRLSLTSHFRQGMLVAAFFGAASFTNLRALPHPAWFWVGNLVVLFVALWVGVRWGLPKNRSEA
jgi:hypothetical protein